MTEHRSDDALTSLLRAGDPAADDPGLDSRERALIRQRMLATSREGRRQMIGWLVPAATAMALLALALGLALRQPRTPLYEPVAERAPDAPASSIGQQIQFTTDSGILVVWVLQPRLSS